MSDLTREERIALIDKLEQLRFFNQRVGRELWGDKPREIQDKDIENADEILSKAISALSTEGEYIKKEDALNAIRKSSHYGRTQKIYVCHREVVDSIDDLPTYSFPDSAENKGEWIPVSERLPKIADVYRVTRYYPNNVMNPRYLVDACAFDGSNTWYNDNRINHERAYVNNVIAWQENPEPYKAEKGGE